MIKAIKVHSDKDIKSILILAYLSFINTNCILDIVKNSVRGGGNGTLSFHVIILLFFWWKNHHLSARPRFKDPPHFMISSLICVCTELLMLYDDDGVILVHQGLI